MLIFDQLNKADRHLRLLSWCVAAGLVILLGGLWWVQVVRSRHYVEDQRNQSSRTVRVPGPRGKILDRNGVALAENVPVYNISLYLHDRGWRALAWNEYLRTRDAALKQTVPPTRKPSWLARFLAWTGLRSLPTETRKLDVAAREELRRQSRYVATSNLVQQLGLALGQVVVTNEVEFRKEFHEHYDQRRALPMPILSGLNSSQIARFLEQGTRLPGLDMEIQSFRVYPQHTNGAHVLGYLRRSEESAEDELSFYNYRLPDYRGVSGIEYSLDDRLRGKAGAVSVVVNNLGYRQSETTWSAVEAGHDVTLTIDAELQRKVQAELEAAAVQHPTRGAAVVMDCRNGEILALASVPGFDPNKFIPRFSPADSADYNQKDLTPLLNRAVYGGYPPGSTFKIVVALAALDAGLLNPQDVYRSEGLYRLGNRAIGDTAGPGDFNFRRAFIKSSNPYFIKYGLDIGRERIVTLAQRLHFGERTGIPLGQDSAGVLPTPEWVRENRPRWSQADTANISIGQDPLKVTPLQLAVAISAVANGGKVLWPQLVQRVVGPDELIAGAPVMRPHIRDDIQVSKRALDVVREAMLADVEDQHEGGGKAARMDNFRICGKTGTAEVWKGNRKDHYDVWFASYAPYEDPRYAVVVMVEHGSSGGGTCAPIAGRIYQTLRERELKALKPKKNALAAN